MKNSSKVFVAVALIATGANTMMLRAERSSNTEDCQFNGPVTQTCSIPPIYDWSQTVPCDPKTQQLGSGDGEMGDSMETCGNMKFDPPYICPWIPRDIPCGGAEPTFLPPAE